MSHSNSIISTSFFENQIFQIFLNRFYFEKFRSIALFQCIIFYVMLIKKNMFLKTYNQMRKNQKMTFDFKSSFIYNENFKSITSRERFKK